MASKKSFLHILNTTPERILMHVTEVDSNDWDGDSRPDRNIHGRTLEPYRYVKEREEINSAMKSHPYRITFSVYNGDKFTYRFDQNHAFQTVPLPELFILQGKEYLLVQGNCDENTLYVEIVNLSRL